MMVGQEFSRRFLSMPSEQEMQTARAIRKFYFDRIGEARHPRTREEFERDVEKVRERLASPRTNGEN